MLKHILMWPFLPREVRLRLRHQHLDGEASKRTAYLLATPDIAVTLLRAADSHTPGRGMRLVPTLSAYSRPAARIGTTELGRWYRCGAMEWDGERVTVVGPRRPNGEWMPTPGGLLPGFDAVEVFGAGGRPTGSGECRDRIAAIATVGLVGRHLQRILFLDEEARELASIPAQGFAEDDLLRFAEAAGIAYRSYAFAMRNFSSLRVSPGRLCEALFTRSALRVKLVSDDLDDTTNWHSETLGR